MESQINSSQNISAKQPPIISQTCPIQQKGGKLSPVLTIFFSAILFGTVGYYLGMNQNTLRIHQLDQSEKNLAVTFTPTIQPTLQESQTNNNPERIFEFYNLPKDWITDVNEARTKKDCYRIVVKTIGKIDRPIKDYFIDEYNFDSLGDINSLLSSTPQYSWPGIESYTFPSLGIGEVNTIYISPEKSQWYKIVIDYIGPGEGGTPPEGFSCNQEEKEIEVVMRNLKFL